MLPKDVCVNRTFVLRSSAIRDAAQRFVGELPVSDRPLEVVIRPHKSQRSLSENAKYWALLSEIGDALGYHRDEMHDVFRELFLPAKWVKVNNEEYRVLASSAKLDVGAFAEYLDRIEQWAAENGIQVTA